MGRCKGWEKVKGQVGKRRYGEDMERAEKGNAEWDLFAPDTNPVHATPLKSNTLGLRYMCSNELLPIFMDLI